MNFRSYNNWINEKFEENSDPIEDLRIGIHNNAEQLLAYFSEKFKKELNINLNWKHDVWLGEYFTASVSDRLKLVYVSKKCVKQNNFESIKSGFTLTNSYEMQILFEGILDMDECIEKVKSALKREKYTNESLNEKFEEHSDPIRDLGIGEPYLRKTIWVPLYNRMGPTSIFTLYREFFPGDKYVDVDSHVKTVILFIYEIVRKITVEKIKPTEAFKSEFEYWNKEAAFTDLIWGIDEFKENVINLLNTRFYMNITLNESLNEKFTDDSDAIHDMGIGWKYLIEEWFKEMEEDHSKFEDNFVGYGIDGNGFINAVSVNIAYRELSKLPEYIRFGQIKNNFTCCFDDIETIKNNGPTSVGGCYMIYHQKSINFTEEDVKKICKCEDVFIVAI